MISYEVTLQAQPALAGSVEEFMRQSHIPAILATGCFRHIWFTRASAGRFRTSYQAATQADLDRYLQDHAPRFRAEFLDRFSDGVSVTRETWVLMQAWSER
jgi:hypothetical protein